MTSQEETSDASLARFAAEALDWPAVRDLLAPLAPSALGRRALLELVPRERAEAEAALARSRELLARGRAGADPPLGGAPDPLPTLRNAHRYRRTLSGEELLDVARFLRSAGELGDWLAAHRAELPVCARLWDGLPDLSDLRADLEGALDRRGRVHDDATPVLKRLRVGLAALTAEIERIVRELAARPALRNALAEGLAVHRRGGRRVLAVRQRYAGQVPGIVHDRSQSGETLYVEPRAAVELGNQVATLQADAEREVARVLSELTRAVVRRRDALERIGGRMAELELALVSARYAAEHDGRPALLPGAEGGAEGDARRGLLLRAFRHPLLIEEARLGRVAEVVPIDLRLGDDFDLLVVTGPNTGGKTLALKGAGLAALMTRMGLAIPCAEGSTVPLYDGVVADIGDEQEIQQSLSTFSSHLLRIRRGLERASEGTLVLLDELGGGTDPAEGAALGEAILTHLLERRVPTLASTHLGKLKELAYRHERAENGHVEFDLETLAPRYALVIGAPGQSRALAVARRLGLPSALVDRAGALLEPSAGEAEQLMEEVSEARVEAERQRSAAEHRRVELEERLAEAAADRERLVERRDQLEAEAQRGLEERFARARDWLERARGLLPQIESGARPALEEILDGLELAVGDATLTERRRDFVAALKKGSTVWLPRFKKRCQVARVHKDRRELEVVLGKRRMTVGFDDVTFYESL